MIEIITIKDFWMLSREERQALFEQEGIGYSFLRDYWSAYDIATESAKVENLYV